MENLANQKYWDGIFKHSEYEIVPKSNFIRIWIEHYFPVIQNKSCLEIGCYPGRFLAVFGERGYELYGIDLCEQLDPMQAAMKSKGNKIGHFWKSDFTSFKPDQQFDVVASFGFIEHYVNWPDILRQHIVLVKPKGSLIIETPNFVGGFQRWFHSTFCKASFDRHYLPSIDTHAWEKILIENGFDIVFSGFFGKFHFWYEEEERNLWNKLMLILFRIIKKILTHVLSEGKKFYAPFCGVVARRIQ